MLIATDPPDPLVDVARRLARHERVLGTGTYLDSLRFRVHLAQRLGVNASSVNRVRRRRAWHVERVPRSSATIGGTRVEQMIADRGSRSTIPPRRRARSPLRQYLDHRGIAQVNTALASSPRGSPK